MQFDKWGGGFVLEIAQITATTNLPDYLAEVPRAELTSFHLPFAARARLMVEDRIMTDGWFRYDHNRPWWKLWSKTPSLAEQQAAAAADAVRLLPQAEAWWMGERRQPNIRPFSEM